MQVELTCFEWLILYSWPLRGTVESTATPRPVSWSRWRNSEVSILHAFWKLCECTSNSRFLSDYPIISDPSRGTVERSTLPRLYVSRSRRCSCEVSTLHLENCAMQVEFTFFEVINPLFLTPMGDGRNFTPPRPVTESRRRSCEVSTLHLENCASARRIHVFWVINPLFLTLWGNGRNVNPSTTCPEQSPTFLWSFNSSSWNCANACRIHVFWVINPLFLTPWRNGRIVNPSTTCPGVSSTFELWSFNSSSWKLCKCTSNSRFLSD